MIKGWCPGALRPMESGDGLIVRLRIACGELAPELAAEIADWARDYGNGAIDLSARANLQLRGVTPATLAPLTARLAARGLLDDKPEAEAVRNVLVSPFAGLDPSAPMDMRPLARALEAELSTNSRLWRLPGKFGFAFDAGAYPLGETRPDVTFEAIDARHLVVRLAGAAGSPLGPVAREDVVAIALRLAEAFLTLRADARRMRDALRLVGVQAFAEAARLARLPESPAPAARPLADMLGERDGFLGLALPFGRIDTASLRALARAPLRLTPWRIVLAQGLGASDIAGLDLITDPADPRLKIAACPGKPACLSAAADTRADALRLAPLLARLSGDAPLLHVSGCAKGCAHPAPTRFAAMASREGYDLVVEGEMVARGLTLPALQSYLEAAI
jgi:precorrin-3B synthase